MEKCDGGELFTHIVKNRRFEEPEASAFCYEMLKAIKYIHSCCVVHRDIKAENFLFFDQPRHGKLVLIDFGMSTRVSCSLLWHYWRSTSFSKRIKLSLFFLTVVACSLRMIAA